ncbi:MAG: hypothetical protein ACRDR6_30685 [Pseudonocardiaceae bacterium]
MGRISRARRAQLQRAAHEIRRRGQRSGSDVARIAADIQIELPELLALEAWRLAYGWTRPQVIAGIAALYAEEDLADPPVTPSMLCRWEHGDITVSEEYGQALSRLYQASPRQLGLRGDSVSRSVTGWQAEYVAGGGNLRVPGSGCPMTTGNDAPLAALRESIELALEVEGPAGGPLARQHLAEAISYYALRYSAFAPGYLAVEVHRTRSLIAGMLRQPQDETSRTELRLHAGWLSALVGNLAFHLADYPAAAIHFGTAARLGTAVGHHHLICWSLGAQSMTAYTQRRHPEALDLARQAGEYADTPLRRAQILAWGELRSLAAFGDARRREAERVMAQAQDQMAADPHGDQPGRFGFDTAELHLHLAEASLVLGDHGQARAHAEASQQHIPHGRPGWAAAVLVQARGEAARGRDSDATALAHGVLDTIAAPALRETLRVRLRDLDRDLLTADPGNQARELRERLHTLPPLVAAGRASDEPNSQ